MAEEEMQMVKIHKPAEGSPFSEQPGALRWVRRHGQLVLQQQWIIKTWVATGPFGQRTEWHDVPTFDESELID